MTEKQGKIYRESRRSAFIEKVELWLEEREYRLEKKVAPYRGYKFKKN